MKNLITRIVLITLVLFTIQTYAQTVTNVNELQRLADEFAAEWEVSAEKVIQYAEEHNVPVRFESDGRLYEMVDVRDGKPAYYVTYNLGAAHTTQAYEVWPGNSAGLNLNGDGYDKVAVWDGGAILTTHQEFTDQGPSRITKMDGNYPSHYHATHVGGTIAAAGINANAKGMAYGVSLDSYQWSADNSEMAAAAAAGLEISNHSYGFGAGWQFNENNGSWNWLGSSSIDPNEDYKFGYYGTDDRTMDQIAFNAPYYLIVRAVGNDRGMGPSNAGQDGNPEKNGGDNGYDCITPENNAKNVLSVGAVDEVWNYTGPEDVHAASFSNWGPTDDGRVKPDIVGKGLAVFSCDDDNNADYATRQGTSMSAPNVTGSLVLLKQHYQNLNGGTRMRAATLKGIALHTTNEAGPDPGPDYMFGWGLMNTKRAAFQISDGQGQNSIDERILDGGDIYMRGITVPEGKPELRVTISWTDPPATPVSPQLNSRTPKLVNDLDLKVLNSGNDTFYPYSLHPDNPSGAATTYGKNNVDNIEMVLITDPEPGTYTIYVDHDGSLSGGEQAYTLIITGIDDYTIVPDCTVGMTTPEDGTTDILVNEWLEWEPANFANSYDVYFGTDGGGSITPTNVYNGENMTTNGFSYYMNPNTTYYLQVVPRNSQGVATGCNQIYSFTTMEAISLYPHQESFLDANPPNMAFGWQSVDLSDGIWQSTDLIGQNDNSSMFCVNPAGYIETEYNNWLVSPPFAVVAGREYYITYFYKGLFPTTPEALSLYWGYSPYVEDMTNLLFEDNEIMSAPWLEGSGIIASVAADVIFFAWHLTSPAGKATLLDDVKVEDWGPVGVNPGSETGYTRIYSYQDQVFINADESWIGSRIQVLNLMGQLIYSGKYQNNMKIDMSGSTPGLYLINLGDGNNGLTKKLLIN